MAVLRNIAFALAVAAPVAAMQADKNNGAVQAVAASEEPKQPTEAELAAQQQAAADKLKAEKEAAAAKLKAEEAAAAKLAAAKLAEAKKSPADAKKAVEDKLAEASKGEDGKEDAEKKAAIIRKVEKTQKNLRKALRNKKEAFARVDLKITKKEDSCWCRCCGCGEVQDLADEFHNAHIDLYLEHKEAQAAAKAKNEDYSKVEDNYRKVEKAYDELKKALKGQAEKQGALEEFMQFVVDGKIEEAVNYVTKKEKKEGEKVEMAQFQRKLAADIKEKADQAAEEQKLKDDAAAVQADAEIAAAKKAADAALEEAKNAAVTQDKENAANADNADAGEGEGEVAGAAPAKGEDADAGAAAN